MNLIIAMLMLGIIIIIHKFGRFLFAKLNGIGVIEFSLGVGSRLFSFEKGDTRYSFKILPFGSSYMVLGEDKGIADESVFNDKSVWARVPVVVTEPVFNFILISDPSVMLIDVTGYDTTRLAGVINGYPAQAASMEAGDMIKSINSREIRSYRDVNWYLFTHPRKSLKVTWERTEEGGRTERFSTELEPVSSAENNQYMMGVQFNPIPSTVENMRQLLVHSAYKVQYWIHYVFDASYMVLHGTVSASDISGPVEIASAIDITVDKTAPYGLSAIVLVLINFTILLNASLGVMNLLPIPALDGGHLVFLIAEVVRGKPIDKEEEGIVHVVGVMVLLALMVLILFNDVRKLF